ncbi:MAG TPA: FtsX-like permease family protein [Vicinamibacterales bacterium]|jgi:putative ABC transport system permease protein|nr:FtsX-like permease family protein [Vicinamibacterales bacterium]
MRDIVFGLRQFRRHPWLPLAIVVSLGAAMGIGTSLFSLVNATWFTPWKVADAGRVRTAPRATVSVETWHNLSSAPHAFTGIGAQADIVPAKTDGELSYLVDVSPNFFAVLQVPMALGSASSMAQDAVVLSFRFWTSHFSGDPAIVGKTVGVAMFERRLGSIVPVPSTVVGVAPAGFTGIGFLPADVWRPFDPARTRNLLLFGRLTPGASESEASAELGGLALTKTDSYSQSKDLSGPAARSWYSTLAGVIFITLIACANVMNLLLALGQSRRSEIALRMAIGASRLRVVRQLLTETLLLSLVSGAVGLAVAAWLPGALIARITAFEPRLADFFRPEIDGRVFFWSLAVSVLACFVFGLMPALRSTEMNLNDAMTSGQANSRKVLMPALLSVQTIVSAMALSLAGFLLRTPSVRQLQSLSMSPAAGGALIVASFGAVAALLGAIGYFSMLEYLVRTRTREIGIRRALGAGSMDVVKTVTVGAALPVARGFLIGSLGALVIGYVMKRGDLPAGVNPFDLMVYATAAMAIVLTTTVAAFWPTRRALSIEPQRALRTN